MVHIGLRLREHITPKTAVDQKIEAETLVGKGVAPPEHKVRVAVTYLLGIAGADHDRDLVAILVFGVDDPAVFVTLEGLAVDVAHRSAFDQPHGVGRRKALVAINEGLEVGMQRDDFIFVGGEVE